MNSSGKTKQDWSGMALVCEKSFMSFSEIIPLKNVAAKELGSVFKSSKFDQPLWSEAVFTAGGLLNISKLLWLLKKRDQACADQLYKLFLSPLLALGCEKWKWFPFVLLLLLCCGWPSSAAEASPPSYLVITLSRALGSSSWSSRGCEEENEMDASDSVLALLTKEISPTLLICWWTLPSSSIWWNILLSKGLRRSSWPDAANNSSLSLAWLSSLSGLSRF